MIISDVGAVPLGQRGSGSVASAGVGKSWRSDWQLTSNHRDEYYDILAIIEMKTMIY